MSDGLNSVLRDLEQLYTTATEVRESLAHTTVGAVNAFKGSDVVIRGKLDDVRRDTGSIYVQVDDEIFEVSPCVVFPVFTPPADLEPESEPESEQQWLVPVWVWADGVRPVGCPAAKPSRVEDLVYKHKRMYARANKVDHLPNGRTRFVWNGFIEHIDTSEVISGSVR